jgi:hypothetical protein
MTDTGLGPQAAILVSMAGSRLILAGLQAGEWSEIESIALSREVDVEEAVWALDRRRFGMMLGLEPVSWVLCRIVDETHFRALAHGTPVAGWWHRFRRLYRARPAGATPVAVVMMP